MSDYMPLPKSLAARRYGIPEEEIIKYFSAVNLPYSTVVVASPKAAHKVAGRVRHISITDPCEPARGMPENYRLGQITYLQRAGAEVYSVRCV
jgi:DICT domain-containing protein